MSFSLCEGGGKKFFMKIWKEKYVLEEQPYRSPKDSHDVFLIGIAVNGQPPEPRNLAQLLHNFRGVHQFSAKSVFWPLTAPQGYDRIAVAKSK